MYSKFCSHKKQKWKKYVLSNLIIGQKQTNSMGPPFMIFRVSTQCLQPYPKQAFVIVGMAWINVSQNMIRRVDVQNIASINKWHEPISINHRVFFEWSKVDFYNHRLISTKIVLYSSTAYLKSWTNKLLNVINTSTLYKVVRNFINYQFDAIFFEDSVISNLQLIPSIFSTIKGKIHDRYILKLTTEQIS